MSPLAIVTASIKLRLPAGLHARLAAVAGQTPWPEAEIVRRALRAYRRAQKTGVAIHKYTEPATRTGSVVLTVNAVPMPLLQALFCRGVRPLDVLAWYLDRQEPKLAANPWPVEKTGRTA
jgi:hypothetical protein